ncbi:hypothetical protein AUJ95_05190 [Candidatus Desantisbacteria bacterium CG2_30_40_21]|uniref:Polymerase nucleotidyl transferase domain-containing protein n=5 Tax=unclassified Candidatus Desantisiibacteriota TaxID=3106372 RepID=A0A1J5E8Z8_9BACT|nr:MAG: hypothetical protein AUJ95_05190 [Candidatus Desantisbacteria bacterium CG2_30_40_21]
MELEGLIKGLNKTRFPFNILGIILFGSYVKNRIKPSSDIDFLIMAEGINLKLHRRFKEIVLIKEALPALPFDILLFTKDGGKWGQRPIFSSKNRALSPFSPNDQGDLLIKINEYEFPKIPCRRITYNQFMRFAKFGFKPSHLKRGINIITLKVTSGAIVQIPRDNWRNYSRSYISSNNGISWERVKEELMIEIELLKTI